MRRDDLEDHHRLMGCSVRSRHATERHTIFDPMKLHQRIDPSCGIGSPQNPIFRPQDQIEPLARRNENSFWASREMVDLNALVECPVLFKASCFVKNLRPLLSCESVNDRMASIPQSLGKRSENQLKQNMIGVV